MAKRKLGRGLDMLISRGESPQRQGKEVLYLHPSEIEENPQQPRQDFAIAELETLKRSISKEGVLQPLLVRRVGEIYQLIVGERRLRASRELALEKVPVILTDLADDRLLEVALVENIHRSDLNSIELAQAYRHLMDLRGWSQEQLASELGIARPSVSNTLRLLDLPEDMQRAIVRSQITMGHAKVLLSVEDERVRRLLFEKIAEENLSVRQTELARDGRDADPEPAPHVDDEVDEEVQAAGGRRSGARGGKGPKSANIVRLEEELMEALGTRVTIRLRGKRSDKGVLSVSFDSKDEFQRLRSLLMGRVEV
jgi:ParB family chromosome partitioning protein